MPDTFDPAEAAAQLRRTEVAAAAALMPNLRLLCWVWAAAWLVVGAVLQAWTAGSPGWVAALGAVLAFGGAGAVTGLHTARRTGLAVEGVSARAGARAGGAIGLTMLLGGAAGVWAAAHGVGPSDAVRLGLAVGASASAAVTIAQPWPGVRVVAAVAAGVALAWFLVPGPSVGAFLLAVALLVGGFLVGRQP